MGPGGLSPGGLNLPPRAHGSDKNIPLQSSVLCSRGCPALIPPDHNTARAVSSGCATTHPPPRLGLLDHPRNAEEALNTPQEPLAPPEMEGQWLCLGREML